MQYTSNARKTRTHESRTPTMHTSHSRTSHPHHTGHAYAPPARRPRGGQAARHGAIGAQLHEDVKGEDALLLSHLGRHVAHDVAVGGQLALQGGWGGGTGGTAVIGGTQDLRTATKPPVHTAMGTRDAMQDTGEPLTNAGMHAPTRADAAAMPMIALPESSP